MFLYARTPVRPHTLAHGSYFKLFVSTGIGTGEQGYRGTQVPRNIGTWEHSADPDNTTCPPLEVDEKNFDLNCRNEENKKYAF